MKFLVPNCSCLQNPWLGGYRPQIPVLSLLNWICWTPPNKIPVYATGSSHSVAAVICGRWTSNEMRGKWSEGISRVAVPYLLLLTLSAPAECSLRSSCRRGRPTGRSGCPHCIRLSDGPATFRRRTRVAASPAELLATLPANLRPSAEECRLASGSGLQEKTHLGR